MYAQGAIESSITLFSEAISLNAIVSSYWIHRAIAHVADKHYLRALKDTEQGLSLNSRQVEGMILKAKLLWKLALIEQGNVTISHAYHCYPNHPEVRHDIRAD